MRTQTMFYKLNIPLQLRFVNTNIVRNRKFLRGEKMLTYTKLWILLDKKGMKRTDLKKIMSSATLAKLGKNEPISSTVIEKICNFLNCQPGDIMENVTEEDIKKATDIMNEKINEMMNLLTTTTGMSKEAILNEFTKELPEFMEALKKDEIDIFEDLIKSNPK